MSQRSWLIMLGLFIGILPATAQNVLPNDSRLTIGKLANGLTYYIIPNKKPEQKVELRLVINAGSINEDDDQQGLAHMCEHMAFNGTTHFKKNEIVSFLQDIGVGFGNDLNAYTSFDKTVYILPIPTDKPGNLEKGFQVIEDWAHNVTYNDDDIDGERPIILEESRLGKGAGDRMNKKLYPRLLKGSLYANRLPIGIDSIIKTFKYEAIRRFYHDWYRPDLMAVMVVGDITKENAETMIKKHFASLVNPVNERVRKYAEVPPYTVSDAMVVTDKEATSYDVSVDYSSFKKEPFQTETDYNNNLIRSLFRNMFNQRLQDLTQKENPPFVYGYVNFGSIGKGYDAISLGAGAGTQNPLTALQAIITETERAKRYGFTAPELERAKKTYLSSIEKLFNDRDKTESGRIINGLLNTFLENQPYPGIENEFNLVKKLLPAITLQDVNSVFNLLKGEPFKFVSVNGPEGSGKLNLPDSAALLQTIASVEKQEIKPYEEKQLATSLMTKEPIAGKVVSKTNNSVLGTSEITLSNGIKVSLKKTDFKNDEIVLNAARFGGMNEYNEMDKYNATYATSVVASMGFGNFTPADLKKVIAGKTATIGASFSAIKDGFSGSSSVKDFETMLQLLYLRVTAPRKDTGLFNSFVQKQKSQFAMLGANPQAAFLDTFNKVMYNNNPLAPITVPHSAYFDKINIDRALDIYKAHFGDMSGMQFAIVGNIDEAVAIPLIEKYIGSLPVTGKKFNFTDNKVRQVKGKQNLTAYRGKEEKSLILEVFSGEKPYSEDEDLKTAALTSVLNIKIIEELREKVQGIYGGGIFGSLEKYPYSGYSFVAQLPCGPEKADTLIKALQIQIDEIRKNGIAESYLNKVKQEWLEKHKEEMKSNNNWAANIIETKVEGSNPDRFINYEKYVNELTVADIRKTAEIYLNGENVLIAQLMPAKYDPQNQTSTNGRKNVLIKNIETQSGDIKIELFDNGEVDGDEVTIYFNGNVVSSKAKLTANPIVFNLKAEKGATNELVMFAENLGTIPPNTALLKVTCDGKTTELHVESDLSKNGAIRFTLK